MEEQQHHNIDSTAEMEEAISDAKKETAELKSRLTKALEGHDMGSELSAMQEKIDKLEAEKIELNADVEQLTKDLENEAKEREEEAKSEAKEEADDGASKRDAEKLAAELAAVTKERDELLAAKKSLADAGSAEARVHELEDQLALLKENTELKSSEAERAMQTMKDRLAEQQKERDENMLKVCVWGGKGARSRIGSRRLHFRDSPP